MDFPHLSSAPISEAIFDIRVKTRPDFQVSEFSELKTTLQEQFPKVEERRGGQFTIHFEPSGPQPPNIQDLGLQGFFFKSQEENLIAQFRVDGFSLNKLKPYTSWDDLQPLVVSLWNQYKSIAKPLAITRCALRYINHILINQTQIDFDDYLKAGPQVPPELPQTINGFMTRITIVDESKLIAAHVTQLYDPRPPIQNTPIILDIDAFKNIDIELSDTSLWEVFADLRIFKNEVFFNFLTEKSIGQMR